MYFYCESERESMRVLTNQVCLSNKFNMTTVVLSPLPTAMNLLIDPPFSTLSRGRSATQSSEGPKGREPRQGASVGGEGDLNRIDEEDEEHNYKKGYTPADIL